MVVVRKTVFMSLQKDIAERLGVSQGIVSHILSGRRKVRTDLHKRIVRESKRMGYVRNHAAAALRTGRRNTWGVILPRFSFMADFNRQIVQGMWEVASANRMSLSVAALESEYPDEMVFMQQIREGRFDGLFLFYEGDNKEDNQVPFEEIKRHGVATVVVNCPLYHDRTNYVCSDGENGMYQAVKHLIEVHHRRRIAYVCRAQTSWVMEDRFKGYVRALKEAGLPLNSDLIWNLLSTGSYERDAEIAVNELLARGVEFDAVCAPMDYAAIPTMSALKDHEIRVPEDVSVTGFDDYHLCNGVRPRLTTVHCDGVAMGRKAGQIMLDILANPKDKTIRKSVIPTSLVIRESCGCRIEGS